MGKHGGKLGTWKSPLVKPEKPTGKIPKTLEGNKKAPKGNSNLVDETHKNKERLFPKE